MHMHTTCCLVGLALTVVLLGGSARAVTNDDFTNATPITGESVQVTGINTGFTAEVGEPQHSDSDAGSSAWWVWSNDVPGFVTIHTLGSDFDTRMAVYVGTNLSDLALVSDGGNDDYGTCSQSLVHFYANGGTVYWIAVDGMTMEGHIRLSVVGDEVRQSASAVFTNRVRIVGVAAEWSGCNSNVLAETNAPWIGGVPAACPLWFTWTASKSCLMEADTRGSGLDTVLGVYTGAVLESLTEVVSTNGCGTDKAARVWWDAKAGTEYQIAVDSVGWEWGVIKLALREVERPAISGVGAGSVRWGSMTGECYRVSSSTNLVQWVAVTSVVAEASETHVSGMAASTPRAFYRIERYLP